MSAAAADSNVSGIGGSGQKKRPLAAAAERENGPKAASAKKQRSAGAAASKPKAAGGASSSTSEAKRPLPMYNSLFEFNEAGANKIVIDTIQYEVDGLFSTYASKSLRRHCASKLFDIVSESIDNKHIVVASGVSRTLIRVTGLLASEDDSHVRATLLAMLLFLCRDDRGVIDSASIAALPVNVFEGAVAATADAMISIKERGNTDVSSSSGISAKEVAPGGSVARKRSFAVQRLAPAPTAPRSPAQAAAAPPAGVLAYSTVQLAWLLGNPSECSSDDVCLALGLAFLNRVIAVAVSNASDGADGSNSGLANGAAAEAAATDLAGQSRQLQLTQFQRALCTPRQHFPSAEGLPALQPSGSSASSLTHLLCNDLFEGVLRIESDTDSSFAAPSSSTRLRVWHLLGIIECASCNCPESQELLATVVCSAGGKDEPAAVVVFRLFRVLSAMVLRDLICAEEACGENNNHKHEKHENKNENKNVNDGNNDYDTDSFEEQTLSALFNGREVDKDQVRCLYPELCSRESAPAASGGEVVSSAGPRLSNSRQRLSLTCNELWLSSLRVLVNLTHGCTRACDQLRAAAFLPFVTAVLAALFELKWRRTAARGSSEERSGPFYGPLSPTETRLEKAVFDASLFMTSAITNIYESSSLLQLSGEACDECHAFSTSKLSHILAHSSVRGITEALWAGAAGGREAAIRSFEGHVRIRTRQLRTAGASRGATSPDPPPADCSNSSDCDGFPVDFATFLIAFLSAEAADFLGDIVRTDDAFSGAAKGASPPPPQGSSSLTPPGKAGEQLPVAELILSSHIVLLLYAAASRGREVGGPSIVEDFLPRNSWWLPTRVLKAFLALQGRAGVLVVASVAPVVAALTSMAQWDGQPAPGGAPIDSRLEQGLATDDKPPARGEGCSYVAAATGRWVRDRDDYRWVEMESTPSQGDSVCSSGEHTAVFTISSLSSSGNEPPSSSHSSMKVRTFSKKRGEATTLVDVLDMALY